MKRLTTDHPEGNFETALNFVFSKDGWAHILADGKSVNVPLHDWVKAQCLERGCDELTSDDPEEIDEAIFECVMDVDYDTGKTCPVAMAYLFACQACQLRDRLKKYEDLFFDEDKKEKFHPLDRIMPEQ